MLTLRQHRWTTQQKLFVGNDSNPYTNYTNLELKLYESSLYATFTTVHPVGSLIYHFQRFSSGRWTQIQVLSYPNSEVLSIDANYNLSAPGASLSVIHNITRSNFTHPRQFGSTLLVSGNEELLIYSQLTNQSCLVLWLSDHFGDGWDTATLTVRAPDVSNDTFHPHCDQVRTH